MGADTKATAPVSRGVLMTPSLAGQYLSRNTINRPLRREHVKDFVELIEAGEYDQFHCVPIAVSDDGRLVNGQHRLAAIVQTGKPQHVMLTIGVPTSQIYTCDTMQKPRSAADAVYMAGGKNGSNVGAAVRLIDMWETGKWGKAMPPKSVAKWVERHPEIHEIVSANVTATRSTGLHGSGLAFVWKAGKMRDRASEFVHLIDVPVGVASPAHPAITVGRRVRAERSRGHVRAKAVCEMLVRGFNAFSEGRDLTRVYATGNIPGIRGAA